MSDITQGGVHSLSIQPAAVSSDTKVLYAAGCDTLAGDRSAFEKAIQVAEQADAVVLVLGDRSGLTLDCTTGETRDSADLKLPGLQEDLAELLQATRKPLVIVLITGRPYALPRLVDIADTMPEAWLPGRGRVRSGRRPVWRCEPRRKVTDHLSTVCGAIADLLQRQAIRNKIVLVYRLRI